ncbi:pseudouridine synthase [Acinetobacter marinus]|uniref:pseudouridine synthase n=1 Tax=Acinetobacter marinus TaxID=281375 RepID=UPI000B80E429|nr:pseudouridine synthase [Acinetobacter marinus]
MKIVALNKPFNVHSQFRSEDQQITLSEFIADPNLRIAGRLDRDSEGLILLTDDGQLNQQITHPKHKQYKSYVVQVEGEISDQAIAQLQQGIHLKDGLTLPAKASKIEQPAWLWQRDPPIRHRANIPTSWLEIQICEGRNRQVRRMTAAVGFPTLRLIRTQIGSVNLIDLGLGLGESTTLEALFYDEFRHLLQKSKTMKNAYEKNPSARTAKTSSKHSRAKTTSAKTTDSKTKHQPNKKGNPSAGRRGVDEGRQERHANRRGKNDTGQSPSTERTGSRKPDKAQKPSKKTA